MPSTYLEKLPVRKKTLIERKKTLNIKSLETFPISFILLKQYQPERTKKFNKWSQCYSIYKQVSELEIFILKEQSDFGDDLRKMIHKH